MAKLILSLDGSVLQEYPLTKERTSIGRKPHNDIQIDNLAVSGEHAVVVMIANDCFLEDVGSTNGTLVNGAPVKKHMLRNNDVIELGKYRLMFVGKSAATPPEPAEYEKTMVWRPAASKAAAAPAGAPAGVAAAAGVTAAGAVPAGAAPAKQPAAAGSAAMAGARTDARLGAAAARASIEPGSERKPIWRTTLVVLAILVIGFLIYRLRN